MIGSPEITIRSVLARHANLCYATAIQGKHLSRCSHAYTMRETPRYGVMTSPPDQSFANLTPMLRQYTQAKAASGTIVLFRLGDFYEMFNEDAQQGSRLLELVLTSREIGKGQRVDVRGARARGRDVHRAAHPSWLQGSRASRWRIHGWYAVWCAVRSFG